ncbi:hypothetical protein [Endozoicomonas arenosclerae]|uniref:hypothetical protein n=1 Tax=Endozoicomonas arenosclerae TaxID=1633495 RepID=UPI00129477AF|nr:hypothetical protein [Endozoicomonas arenosclerae]
MNPGNSPYTPPLLPPSVSSAESPGVPVQNQNMEGADPRYKQWSVSEAFTGPFLESAPCYSGSTPQAPYSFGNEASIQPATITPGYLPQPESDPSVHGYNRDLFEALSTIKRLQTDMGTLSQWQPPSDTPFSAKKELAREKHNLHSLKQSRTKHENKLKALIHEDQQLAWENVELRKQLLALKTEHSVGMAGHWQKDEDVDQSIFQPCAILCDAPNASTNALQGSEYVTTKTHSRKRLEPGRPPEIRKAPKKDSVEPVLEIAPDDGALKIKLEALLPTYPEPRDLARELNQQEVTIPEWEEVDFAPESEDWTANKVKYAFLRLGIRKTRLTDLVLLKEKNRVAYKVLCRRLHLSYVSGPIDKQLINALKSYAPLAKWTDFISTSQKEWTPGLTLLLAWEDGAELTRRQLLMILNSLSPSSPQYEAVCEDFLVQRLRDAAGHQESYVYDETLREHLNEFCRKLNEKKQSVPEQWKSRHSKWNRDLAFALISQKLTVTTPEETTEDLLDTMELARVNGNEEQYKEALRKLFNRPNGIEATIAPHHGMKSVFYPIPGTSVDKGQCTLSKALLSYHYFLGIDRQFPSAQTVRNKTSILKLVKPEATEEERNNLKLNLLWRDSDVHD